MKRKAPQHAAGMTALAVNRGDAKILQDFLSDKFALSRRTAKAMIDGRNVWVNRKCIWIARFELKTGDTVEMPTSVVKGAQAQSARTSQTSTVKPQTSNVKPPTSRHIRVIWSDEHYLVCDKPAGFLSCGDARSVESLLRVQEGVPTLEAVHRLDRDTTGCLMFAKNHAAKSAAIEIFRTHKVTKVYHAISAGRFEYAHRVVNDALDGQEAVSHIQRELTREDACFLRVRIETGRTNQIRRHLASIRHPIVGDRMFGLKSARDARLMQVPRQMLHASSLLLPNPLDPHREIKVHSPLPADFRAALRLFGMGK